jgi:hypothetical protein
MPEQETTTYPCCRHCTHPTEYEHQAPCFVEGCQADEQEHWHRGFGGQGQ